MKISEKSFIIICSVLFLLVGISSGQETLTIKTKSGKIYENAELRKVDSEFALIKHSGGVAQVSLVELAKSERRKLKIKPSLPLLRFDLDRSIAEARIPLAILNEQYLGHLQEALGEAQKSGVLQHLLLVKKEMKEFSSGESIDYTTYPKLGEMRGIYEAQLLKRKTEGVAKLKSAYTEYLKEVKEVEVANTQSGNVEKAIEANKEATRVAEYLSDDKTLESMLGSSSRFSSNLSGDVYLLIASMSADSIFSVNIESGKVKTLFKFEPKTAPRGITADKNSIYVGLRFGSMNVLKLTPNQQAEGGFSREDISDSIGVHGTGHLRLSRHGDLIVAGATGGAILQYDLNTHKPKASLQPIGMKNVCGIDIADGIVYGVEVFEGKIARSHLNNEGKAGSWLMENPSEHLQRTTGIAVGHNGNLFVTNLRTPLVPEFSSESGEFVRHFFDVSSSGETASRSIVYAADLNNYFIMTGGSVLIVDPKGALIKKIPVPPEVNADGIVLVRKSEVSEMLGDKL